MTQQRAGKTVKVSVSLHEDDLASLKLAAKRLYRGNLSAAFADAARLIRQREARGRLVEVLGGSVLTPKLSAALDAEIENGRRHVAKKRRRK